MSRVGILATEGTVRTGLLQKALARREIAAVTPDRVNQRRVTDIIYRDIKAGRPADADAFAWVSDSLLKKGCQCILLGCTELSVAREELRLGGGYLDILDVLARASVLSCGACLKPAYKTLISVQREETLPSI